MSFRIDGYSERGMVNAVCEDIIRDNDLEKLTKFLSWCRFPFQGNGVPDFTGIKSARILVEQGFSDFGDLDLLLLLDQGDLKQSVLIEAKVTTDVPSPKLISDHWNDFLAFLQGDKTQTSSLFVQIYRKLRLIDRVADLNRQFDPHPILGRQSLGENRGILKAARLLGSYRENPWYVVLVPDDCNSVSRFFSNTLQNYCHDPQHLLPNWSKDRIGYLTWPYLHQCFQADPNSWQRSMSAFDWNEYQIYRSAPPNPNVLMRGTVALWNERRIAIVGSSELNPRVINVQHGVRYFPESFTVPATRLTVLNEPLFNINDHQPAQEATYSWNPPSSEQCQPPDRAPVPAPPQRVKVRKRGWESSRVVQVDEDGIEHGEEFHVFTHHLERQEL